MGEMGITRSDYLISITVIVVTTAGLFISATILWIFVTLKYSYGFVDFTRLPLCAKAWLLSSMGNLYDNHKALIRN